MKLINQIGEMLEDSSKHQTVARLMVDRGWTNTKIREYLDSLNFYPNEQWWKWVSQRRAEIEATTKISKALGMTIGKDFFN